MTLVRVPALGCFSRIERVAGLVIEGLVAALSLARQVSDRCINVLLGRLLLSARRLSPFADLGLVRPCSAFTAEVGDMSPERLRLPSDMGHEPGLHYDTTLGSTDRTRARCRPLCEVGADGGLSDK